MNKYFIIFLISLYGFKGSFSQNTISPSINKKCESNSATFVLTQSNYDSVFWQIKTPEQEVFRNLTEFDTNYIGINTDTLSIIKVDTLMNNNMYRCKLITPITTLYSDTGILLVNSYPSSPLGTTIDPDSICFYNLPNTVNLQTANIPNNGEVIWYLNNDSIGNSTSLTYQVTTNNISLGNNYFKTQWANGWCKSDFDSVSLYLVEPISTEISYSTNEFYYIYDTILPSLIFPSNVPGKYFWSSDSVNLSINHDNGAINLPESKIGEYNVYYTILNNCFDTSSITINIIPISSSFHYEVDGIQADTFCKNSQPVAIIDGTKNGIFKSETENLIDDSITGRLNLNTIDAGNYSISYIVYGINDTSETKLDIVIIDLPNKPAHIYTNYNEYCVDSINTLMLYINNSGNTKVNWFKNGTLINNENNDTLILINNEIPDENCTFSVNLENYCGESDTTSINIKVNKPPQNIGFFVMKNNNIEINNNDIVCYNSLGNELFLYIEPENQVGETIMFYKGVQNNIYTGPDNKYILKNNEKPKVGTNEYYAKRITKCGKTEKKKLIIYIDSLYFTKNLELFDTVCNQTLDYELNVKVESALNNTGTLNYNWYHNDNPINQFSSSLTIDTIKISDGGKYYCKASNNICESLKSNTKLLFVKDIPFEIKAKGKRKNGYPVLLYCTVDSLKYQWYYSETFNNKGEIILNANTQYFYPENYNTEFKKGCYALEVSDTTKSSDLICTKVKYYNITKGSFNSSIPSMKIFPNPASGSFKILLNSISSKTYGTIIILNNYGQQVLRLNNQETDKTIEISTRNLNNGLYVVKYILDNKKQFSKRVLIY